jgi:hypothetical protein
VSFKPTAEQDQIVAAAATGADLVIEAGAGTGKTSTLKLLAAGRPNGRGLYLAYNKAIQVDAQRSFPRNVTCKTIHALAFQTAARPFLNAGRQLNGARVPAAQAARILGINEPIQVATGKAPLAPQQTARLALATVKRFCRSADAEITRWHVPPVPGLTEHPAIWRALAEAVVPFARKAWQDLTALTGGRLRFEHDIYLKLYQLSGPVLDYDYILVDEAQDLNPTVKAIVDNQTHLQRILVGDRSQAINGWNGAIDAMEHFDGKRLYLSESFRFGPAIAAEANKWLDILGADLRLTGSGPADSRLGTLDFPDAVLCRTNGTALAEVIAATAAGRRVALVGGGDEIERLARAALDLQTGRGTEHPELMAFTSWNEVVEYASDDESGSDLKTLVKIVEDHGAEDLIRLVKGLTDERYAQVTVSTSHKSKGREWNSVRVAGDFREPKATEQNPDPVLSREDAMLAYVTVTRAKLILDRDGLSWVDRWVPGSPAATLRALRPAAPAQPAVKPAAAPAENITPTSLEEDLSPALAAAVMVETAGVVSPQTGRTLRAGLGPRLRDMPAHCLRCGSERCYCDPEIARTRSAAQSWPMGPAGRYASERAEALYCYDSETALAVYPYVG